MDSMTLVAIVSIICSGLTTALGSVAPAIGEGKAVASALTRFSATARCLQYHHSHAVRRTCDDRIRRYLLPCDLDDSDLCKSVLESRNCARHG